MAWTLCLYLRWPAGPQWTAPSNWTYWCSPDSSCLFAASCLPWSKIFIFWLILSTLSKHQLKTPRTTGNSLHNTMYTDSAMNVRARKGWYQDAFRGILARKWISWSDFAAYQMHPGPLHSDAQNKITSLFFWFFIFTFLFLWGGKNYTAAYLELHWLPDMTRDLGDLTQTRFAQLGQFLFFFLCHVSLNSLCLAFMWKRKSLLLADNVILRKHSPVKKSV